MILWYYMMRLAVDPGQTEANPMQTSTSLTREDDGALGRMAFGELLADRLDKLAEEALALAEKTRCTDFMLHERDEFWRKITMMRYDIRGMSKHIGG